MNDYGFDYMNYITNIPNNMKDMGNVNDYMNQMKKMNSMNKIDNKNKIDNMKNWNNMNKIDNFIQMDSGNYLDKMKNMFKTKESDQIIEPYEGLIRGNIFGNLYEPYKNYKPSELEPNNEREALLYQIMQYKFALVELNLYLDTHPSDRNAIELYNKYLKIEKEMCNKYESMYGPISLDSNYLGDNNWNWKNSPWPWEGV